MTTPIRIGMRRDGAVNGPWCGQLTTEESSFKFWAQSVSKDHCRLSKATVLCGEYNVAALPIYVSGNRVAVRLPFCRCHELLQLSHDLNPRPDGPLDFPPPAGGCLNTPRLSRLLRIVEQNGKRRSKAREQSFRNHFGHLLAQVKIEATRSQNSKIFQNGFWTIKSFILKVEQRF